MTGETYGKVYGVTVSGVLPDFSVSMDLEVHFVWVWMEKGKPDKVAVVSKERPVYVNMSSETWEAEIAQAVKVGCANPGVYFDFELGGAKSFSYVPPVL